MTAALIYPNRPNFFVMVIQFTHGQKRYEADLAQPIDISIPLVFNSLDNPNAWFCPPPEVEAQRFDAFIVSVDKGAAVNSMALRVYPHGNGTHTEGVGHLSSEGDWKQNNINRTLRTFHCVARLGSVLPQRMDDGDRIVSKADLWDFFADFEQNPFEAFILRTLPNDVSQKRVQYSGSNPPYLDAAATAFLAEKNIQHLLLDLPSVDREDDGGKVAAHRAFWRYFPDNTEGYRQHATITELIFVDNAVKDGLYLLNLQIPAFETDAAPSKPVLYALREC